MWSTRRSAGVGSAVATLLLAVAGCGEPAAAPRPATSTTSASTASASAVPTTAAPSPTPSSRCGSPTRSWQVVTFPSASGATIGGLVFGTGRTGLVLAPQLRQDSCSWLAYAEAMSSRGYRVLAIDFAGEGASTRGQVGSGLHLDVEAATTYLRQQGVTRVVLLGTSRGGTAVLVAASRIAPPVAGVVSVSGAGRFQADDARSAVTALRVPVLYLTAVDDPGFNTDAQAMHAATPATTARRLVTVPGRQHGITLMQAGGDGGAAALAAVDAFLASYAPAG